MWFVFLLVFGLVVFFGLGVMLMSSEGERVFFKTWCWNKDYVLVTDDCGNSGLVGMDDWLKCVKCLRSVEIK